MAIQVRHSGAWVDNTGEKKRVNGAWVSNEPYKVMKPTISGIPPFTFKSDGEDLRDWSMSGQTVQSSTPTPANPVAVEGVGTLSGSDYIIPVTCGGTTTNIYLGSASTTRRIKKLVLTGTENWQRQSNSHTTCINLYTAISSAQPSGMIMSNVATYNSSAGGGNDSIVNVGRINNTGANLLMDMDLSDFATTTAWKTYLAQQYANGTPVTVWYVLATPETSATNEPLQKIGTYADELTKTGAGVDIPTGSGSNTLTVGTTVQPSEMSIESISQWV